jgi:hypothetical protein
MSDVRPPADNSHLHADRAELARAYQEEADRLWRELGRRPHSTAAQADYVWMSNRAAHYRRLAAAGESIPNF